MDMRMPVMDGYEATRKIKATIKGQATAVIALTASTLEEEKSIVLSAGCDDFLRKPFRESDIFDLMTKHIGVRYVYEAEEETPDSAVKETALTPESFAALPEALLNRLEEGAKTLDMGLVENLIEEVREYNPSVAQGLSDLANAFQYPKISELIHDA